MKLNRLLTASRHEVLLAIVACTYFSILVSFVSGHLMSRDANRLQSIDHQYAILEERPFVFGDGEGVWWAQWRNRVLFPLALKILDNIQLLNTEESYIVLRILTAFALSLVVWIGSRKILNANIRTTVVALAVLGLSLFYSFNEAWEVPSDFPDVTFMFLITVLALKRRFWPLLGVILIGSANRESVAFAGIVYFMLYGVRYNGKLDFRETAKAALLSIVGYGAAVGIRLLLDGGQGITQQQSITFIGTIIQRLGGFLNAPSPYGWPILLVLLYTPFVVYLLARRINVDRTAIRLIVASMLIGLAATVFGVVSELRQFLPSIAVLLVGCIYVETRTSGYYSVDSA